MSLDMLTGSFAQEETKRLMRDLGLSFSSLTDKAEMLSKEGKTPLYFARGRRHFRDNCSF